MAIILVVEDTLELSAVIAGELEAAGFSVRCAANGSRALAEFDAAQPDLVILDWMLPGMDGLEILRRLRNKSAVPVLMLTARKEEIDRIVGLEVGADDYLTKPFSLRELVARVRALLRRDERLREMIAADKAGERRAYRDGELELLPDSYEAWLHGQPLELTRTEFDLLHLFLRNPGRTFSRTYLFETVWDTAYIDGDRSVDNAILRLRKKLIDAGNAIETVWGVGYRWRRLS
jgi:DNA-binding response OmpR family regulator